MRTLIIPMIVVGLASLGVQAQEQTMPSFSLTIAPSKNVVHAGDPVYIRLKMTNLSAHEVDCSSYYVNGTDRRFKVEIGDQAGHDVKKPEAHPEQMPGSFRECTLAPGESTLEKEFLVSAFHDLTRPGKYFVHVSREESNGAAARSNTISIIVEP